MDKGLCFQGRPLSLIIRTHPLPVYLFSFLHRTIHIVIKKKKSCRYFSHLITKQNLFDLIPPCSHCPILLFPLKEIPWQSFVLGSTVSLPPQTGCWLLLSPLFTALSSSSAFLLTAEVDSRTARTLCASTCVHVHARARTHTHTHTLEDSCAVICLTLWVSSDHFLWSHLTCSSNLCIFCKLEVSFKVSLIEFS